VSGLFGIYELSRLGLLAQQAAMHTTGHNIANAATPGYHRQRVQLATLNPQLTPFGALGSGVGIESVQRIESRFIEAALQREMPSFGRYSARATALAEAELAFSEPSEFGLTSLLDDFYDTWDDLATNPEDPGPRESVVRVGLSLAEAIRNTHERLIEEQRSITTEIEQTVEDANSIVRELAVLNQNILAMTRNGQAAGDLEDRRDLLVETLAELIGANGQIEENGTATVRIGGRIVVQLSTADEIQFDRATATMPSLGGRPFTPTESDGRLGGLLEARDVDLANALERLDAFAVRLVEEVNSLHAGGVDAYGDEAGAVFELPGIALDGVTGAAAAIRVTADLQRDSNRVAAGRTSSPGDNSLALDIAALRNSSEGAAGLLNGLVVDLGARAGEAEDLAKGQQVIVDNFNAQRESISGVSLDEEAASLLMFQRSYQAAAQLLAIADEMAATILSI
jgi:flagellar hook-associated protein 1 FlgK